MNILTIIAVVMGLAVGLGAAAAWFKRSEGENTISLLKTNIESYKTSEAQHLQRISELEATVAARDKALSESRVTLRTVIKEFKEYKSSNGK